MRVLSFDPKGLGIYRHDAFEGSARDLRDQFDTRLMMNMHNYPGTMGFGV